MTEPVNCGCGGEANAYIVGDANGYKGWAVMCEACCLHTKDYDFQEDAIQAWNKALGADHFRDVTKKVERTAQVVSMAKQIKGSNRTITVTSCANCENTVSIFDDYCSGCGAKLDWSGNDGKA